MSEVVAHRALVLHPSSSCDAVDACGVRLSLSGDGALSLDYVVVGRLGRLAVPEPRRAHRGSELWMHTCFELFVKGADGGYAELNVAPSRGWAAYRFDGYRTGMRDIRGVRPRIRMERTDDRLAVSVALNLGALLTGGTPASIGLSAVIEMRNGAKSYWALAHPPGKPDFHHADCFALQLPAAGRS